jgi:hypothetical protein
MESKAGKPTSRRVQRAVYELIEALHEEYGYDFAFSILGRGYFIATSTQTHGRTLPVISEADVTPPVPQYLVRDVLRALEVGTHTYIRGVLIERIEQDKFNVGVRQNLSEQMALNVIAEWMFA